MNIFKKFMFILAFTMTCETVVEATLTTYPIWRCENNEVICYVGHGYGAKLFCKFKETEEK